MMFSLDWFSRENLNRKPMGFYHQIGWAFRFKFSHPIRCLPEFQLEYRSDG